MAKAQRRDLVTRWRPRRGPSIGVGGWIALALAVGAPLAACTDLVSAPARSCNPATHAGCTAEEACVNADKPRCGATGTLAIGATCVDDADCVREAICHGDQGARVCRERCSLGAAACPAGLSCVAATAAANAHGFGVCQPLGCDPFAAASCPAGERCVGGPVPQCSGVIGLAGEGVACKASEACKSGLICAQGAPAAGEPATSTCIALCRVGQEPSACTPEFRCDPLLDSDGFALPASQGTCVLVACNALTDAGCPAGQKCYAAAKPVCSHPGNGGVGAACSKVADCGVGTICILGLDGQRLCRQKCDLSGQDPAFACPAGQSCAEIKDANGDPMPNHVGFCRAAP